LQAVGHAAGWHVLLWAEAPQAAPPKRGCTWVRWRRVAPPPQVLEHWVHADQTPSAQATGHEASRQSCLRRVAPQVLPPFRAARTMLRVETCSPLPQVTGQAPQAPHEDMVQSDGHACVWHAEDSASSVGHGLPPFSDTRETERMRLCSPPPQEREQRVYLVHSVTMQSTGHTWVLHSVTSESAVHALPPWSAWAVMVRVRVRLPPPHRWVQVPVHDQLEYAQSTGQACVLQVSSKTVAAVWHGPARAVRVWERLPVPGRSRRRCSPAGRTRCCTPAPWRARCRPCRRRRS